MSELELLYLVLAVIYVWECACWLRHGTLAFRTWLGRRWSAAEPGGVLGNARGGFVFACPLPPLGALFTATRSPLGFCPEAVLIKAEAGQGRHCVPFGSIETIKAHGKNINLNGRVLIKTGSVISAVGLAQQIESLRSLKLGEREAAILKLLHKSLDTGAVQKLREQFQERTFRLRLLANSLFFYLFLLTPVLIESLGLKLCWLGLLLGLLALTSSIAWLFYRIHRHLYPAADDDRFTHFIILLLSPATAIRAIDTLSRPLLQLFHPLAVAKLICSETQFRVLARKEALNAAFPFDEKRSRGEAVIAEAERHARLLWQRALDEFLARADVSSSELLQPPLPADETCRSYCPRCQAQFTTSTGVCEDCGGLPLVAFAWPPRS